MIEIIIPLLSGIFALIGFGVAHKFSLKQIQAEKRMNIKENFITSHLDFVRTTAEFESVLLLLKDNRVSNLLKSVNITQTEMKFNNALVNFIKNNQIMKVYFKDKKFESLTSGMITELQKLEKLIAEVGPTSHEIEAFVKDKPRFNRFLRKLKTTSIRNSLQNQKIQEYVIKM
jgi:hypothetical protein